MGQLKSDKNFSQVVRKIRDALIIPTYNLSSFHGYEDSFGIFNKTNSSGNPSFSPYDNKSKIKLETIEQVKDRYREAVNWTNWRNLSFIQTFYNFQHNNDIPVDGTVLQRNYSLDKYMEWPFYATHRPRLPLSVQGVSNDTVAQLEEPDFDLQWLDKSEWEGMLETYTDVGSPSEPHEYFLFFPYAEADTYSHNIHYTNNLFAIICLTWNDERVDWDAQSWKFQTPISNNLEEWNPQKRPNTSMNRFFGGNSFPLTDFRHQAEYGDDTSGYWAESTEMEPFAWKNGKMWGVEGGGFYLGQDAKPFLDLFQKTKPEPKGFGLFNWWW